FAWLRAANDWKPKKARTKATSTLCGAPRGFRSETLVKRIARRRLVPMTGVYQKRSARTVGRSTGMFETGKYATATQRSDAPISGRRSLCGSSPRARARRHLSHAETPKTSAKTNGRIIAAAPRRISGVKNVVGAGSCGDE